MRFSSFRPIIVGTAIAATALLSACSGQNAAAPPTTVTGSPENQAQKHQLHTADEPLKDVNCSANGGGKVGPAGTEVVDLIAVASKAGRVGCTEAFTVITEYYRDAPTKSEGTGRALVVRGWQCMADTGAEGTGIIGCDKDGLSFHTGQASKNGGAEPCRTTGSKQHVQILGAQTRGGSTLLDIQPARKNHLGESFETLPLDEPACQAVLKTGARILTLRGESGTTEAFLADLPRRPAHETDAGFDVTFDSQGKVTQVEWLFIPSW